MKRETLETGIYQDAYGIEAIVTVGTVQRSKRYRLDADRAEMRLWREQTRHELKKDQTANDAQRADGRAFQASIDAYLTRKIGTPSHDSDRAHLTSWLPYLGRYARHQIRPEHIEAGIAARRLAGIKASTIRHQLKILRRLYTVLDGRDANHPFKGITLPPRHHEIPIPVPAAVIETVARNLDRACAGDRGRDGRRLTPTTLRTRAQQRARFLVMVTTGQRQVQIGRAKPGHVHLDGPDPCWYVQAAKDGAGAAFPLLPDAVDAWRAFIAADAWGSFSLSAFRQYLRRQGWPAAIRVYQLRHTFAIDLLRQGVPLDVIQGLLGHRSIEVTRNYYAPYQTTVARAFLARRKLNLFLAPTRKGLRLADRGPA